MLYDVQKVRARFPALSLTDDGKARIYLDNPAGTQVPQIVVDSMSDQLIRSNANLGGYFPTSAESGAIHAKAHQAMADFLGASSAEEIIFGQSMTALTFQMTHALESRFSPRDEIIVTRMDHDGNISPWRIMAEKRGLTVKSLPFNPGTFRFDLHDLDDLLSSRTKLVAVGYASNLLGTINDVASIAERARSVGALTYVDAVQFAPHGVVDVQSLNCDFLVCSPYKFYGPHQGVLWGRHALLEELTAEKLRAAPDHPPGKFELGTASFEAMAGTAGAIEHYAWVGKTMAGSADQGDPIDLAKRVMDDYERTLTSMLIDGLKGLGARIYGLTAPGDMIDRVPTVVFTFDHMPPSEVARQLAERNIFVWSGHNYALDLVADLGLADSGGVVRIGMAHYNTADEIAQTLNALEDIAAS